MPIIKTNILQLIAEETKIPYWKIENSVKLLDAKMTIPFISRYRKEHTGELDETQIRQLDDLLKFHRALEQRKTDVLRLIDEQGKLTDDLRTKIKSAVRPTELEDLYRPYRLKRKTRASVAKEKGLESFAAYLMLFPQSGSPEIEAQKYLSDTLLDVQEALQGAKDILAEQVADDPEVRSWVRSFSRDKGLLIVKAKDSGVQSVYTMYYDYKEPVKRLASHRILAINRGEREEYLRVSLDIEEADKQKIYNWLIWRFIKNATGVTVPLVTEAIIDAYKRLIEPAVERDIRNELTEMAEIQAIVVFSKNLRSLLLQRPVSSKVCLAIDPAYRTGCKIAVVDATGKLLETSVIYPTPPHNRLAESEKELDRIIVKHEVQSLILGNGTASRETEQWLADFIQRNKARFKDLAYTIVSEAGASVYSASILAAKEFPELDVSLRSAISLGRRIQDPLAELVKIDPKSVGVGQYQHDLNSKKLDESLGSVVESVVNYVGVNLNTASPSLLKYVAGLNSAVAQNIVDYREQIGCFRNRKELLKVPKLGKRTFEQATGFLRIAEGDNPLDNTSVHPESYKATLELLQLIDAQLQDIGKLDLKDKLKVLNVEKTAEKLGVGIPTLQDIMDSLIRPGRDPREELPPPVFRKDVLSIEELRVGMEFQGVVRNAVDFGIFVDIGVKVDGLVHISEISEKRIKTPLDVVAVGDIVKVKVLAVEPDKNRISLTMKI
jgi:uncharacterized protein